MYEMQLFPLIVLISAVFASLLFSLIVFLKNTKNNELIHAQQALETYRRALEYGALVVRIDLFGKIVYINERVFRLLDYNESDLLGKSLTTIEDDCGEYLGPSQPTPSEPDLDSHSTHGIQIEQLERKARWIDIHGNRHVVERTLIPILDSGGNTVEYIVIGHDVTNRETQRIAASQSGKEKSFFMTQMSHEIRTPLNGIIGFLDLLSKTNLDDNQRGYLDVVRQSSRTLLRIVNDILDFSEIEEGQLSLERIPFDLVTELQETVDWYATKANEKGVALVSEFEAEIPKSILGDCRRLKQIIQNLLSNAVKFTERGGTIRFQVERADTHVNSEDSSVPFRFSITDTGIGIPEAKKQLIFDAFTQAESTETRRFGGVGLGLTISHLLIREMGGRLEMESTEGKGSTFRFILPLELGAHSAARQLSEEKGKETTQAASIRETRSFEPVWHTQFRSMRKALERRDFPSVYRDAHQLAEQTKRTGFVVLSRIAETLEQAAFEKNYEAAEAALTDIDETLGETLPSSVRKE